jgi:branched-chain amino acid transport system ATP-binding protein
MNSPKTTEPLLTTSELVKKFGGLTAVNCVDLTVNEGEILGLIGPNGAGKTTLFQLLSGSMKPTSGKIFGLGRDLTNYPPYKTCRIGITRTHQVVRPLKGMSVLENVMVSALVHTDSLRVARAESEKVLERTGLAHLANENAANLTLAKLKTLELSRALACQPKIMLLDEMMAGLNQTELAEAYKVIQDIHRSGVTLMIVEHIIEAVLSLCSRIVVMNYGKKIADGPVDEVMNDRSVIEAYLGEEVENA